MSGHALVTRRLLVSRRWAIQSLRLASGSSYYRRGGSNPNPISDEAKDLIRHQKRLADIQEWNLGHCIQQPLVYPMKDPEDRDDDQVYDIKYWPHKGERVDVPENPSPVLLIKRVKTLVGEPYYHKESLERLGLGQYMPIEKIAVVPNTPSICWRLFAIKHIVEIVPMGFPMGYPDEDEFDPTCCRVNHKGEFYYHPRIKMDPNALVPQHSITRKDSDIEKMASKIFKKTPFGVSPMGNSNFHRDSGTVNPEMNDHTTDGSFKIKFKELLPRGTERVFLEDSKYIYD